MKIKLSKKEAKVVLACMEEILASPYWTNEETLDAFVGKTMEGEGEIQDIIQSLQMEYDIETDGEVFSRLFVDMDVSPVER